MTGHCKTVERVPGQRVWQQERYKKGRRLEQ